MTTGDSIRLGAAGADIRPLVSLGDFDSARDLFTDLWASPSSPPITANLMRAMAHSGNCLLGAFQGGRLLGAVVGFLGHDGQRPLLHSHLLGVVPDHHRSGLGTAMKLAQREWARARHIELITWTFDPLVARNAYFNLTKLGAEVGEYLPNFYGQMQDGLNRGDESDRILVHWWVSKSGATQEAVHGPATPLLGIGPDQRPQRLELPPAAVAATCRLPEDIVALRRTHPPAAAAWRNAVRDVFADLGSAGWTVAGTDRAGAYRFSRSGA